MDHLMPTPNASILTQAKIYFSNAILMIFKTEFLFRQLEERVDEWNKMDVWHVGRLLSFKES